MDARGSEASKSAPSAKSAVPPGPPPRAGAAGVMKGFGKETPCFRRRPGESSGHTSAKPRSFQRPPRGRAGSATRVSPLLEDAKLLHFIRQHRSPPMESKRMWNQARALYSTPPQGAATFLSPTLAPAQRPFVKRPPRANTPAENRPRPAIPGTKNEEPGTRNGNAVCASSHHSITVFHNSAFLDKNKVRFFREVGTASPFPLQGPENNRAEPGGSARKKRTLLSTMSTHGVEGNGLRYLTLS